MLSYPITKLYEPCPWCNDRGCLSCDAMRVHNASIKRRQIEAGEFIKSYLKGTEQPEDTPISIEVALLVINAIEHGKEVVRREMHTIEAETVNRFDFIEFAEVQA